MRNPSESKNALRLHRYILLVILAFLLALPFAGRQVFRWPVRLRYPGELNYVEGMRLAEMIHLRRGLPIYAPASPERFDAAIYGPVYYLLGARLVDPERPAYLPLRVLSMLGTLGCAAGCGLLAFWLSRSSLAAAVAPLIFLSYSCVTVNTISARSDLVALLLFFVGFLIAYRLRDNIGIFLAIPFMATGFYYKQQFVAGPIAVFLFLILEKRYRRAAEFAGLSALAGLGLAAFFEFAVFPQQAFLHHFLVYNAFPFSKALFVYGIASFGLVLLVPFLLGAGFLRLYPNKLLACYLGCATVISLVTVAKLGSGPNYFLECILVLSTLVAALVAKTITQPGGAAESLLVLSLTLFFAQFLASRGNEDPKPVDFSRDQAVQEFLRRNFAPGTRALGYYAGDLVRAGLETPISDPYQYAQLSRQGIVPERDLLTQLYERRFGVVILTFDLVTEKGTDWTNNYFTDGVRSAILQDYELAATLELPQPEKFRDSDRFYAWVPRASGKQPNGSAINQEPFE